MTHIIVALYPASPLTGVFEMSVKLLASYLNNRSNRIRFGQVQSNKQGNLQ